MITENARLHKKMTEWTMTIAHEVNVVIMLNMILLKIPPDVIGLDKKYRDAIR